MKILGVDPGLLNLGYTLIEVEKNKYSILEGNTIKSKSSDPLPKRLYYLYSQVKKILEIHRPEIIVTEEPIAQANPFSTAKLFQVQGIVLLLAGEKGIPIKVYHPSFWKKFLCGNGSATNEEILHFLRYGLGLNNLMDKIKDEHTCDALAMAIVCAFELKS